MKIVYNPSRIAFSQFKTYLNDFKVNKPITGDRNWRHKYSVNALLYYPFHMTNTVTNRKPIENPEQIAISVFQYVIRKYNGDKLLSTTLYWTDWKIFFHERTQKLYQFRTISMPWELIYIAWVATSKGQSRFDKCPRNKTSNKRQKGYNRMSGVSNIP